MFPQKYQEDHRRWIGGIVRIEKHSSSNLHNHPLHGSTKISQCVQDKIASAVISNPALTPTDIASGKGLGFTPSAVDAASSHLGKLARKVSQVKRSSAVSAERWLPTTFEECADELDENDFEKSNDTTERKQKYLRLGRPYLVSTGMDNGINFIFAMTPFMADVAAKADFIQTDNTYDHMQGYKYLFHAVAFNHVTMEWMIVAHVWLDKQCSNAYALGFKKLFEQCQMADPNFRIGGTLQGIITDWSDAESKGLKNVIGEECAMKLLKGCRVHWLRSCQRICERVNLSENKQLECDVLMKIACQIQTLPSAVEIVACFEDLCGVRTIASLTERIPGICTEADAHFVDSECDWYKAKNWAQWWWCSTHLKMLCKALACMDNDVWEECPTTTNAVECRNQDCSLAKPLHPKLAMIEAYKLDKVTCYKFIAANEGTSISYHSKTDEARKSSAAARRTQRKRKALYDKDNKFGPPDKRCNFPKEKHATEKTVTVDKNVVSIHPNLHPEVVGKRVHVKYDDTDGGCDWYEGIIVASRTRTSRYLRGCD